MEALASSEFNGKLPVLTTPILTDEDFVNQNFGVEGILSMASWSFDDKNPVMKTFLEDYKTAYEDKPGAFSLLGFECALLLAKCVDKKGKVPKQIGDFFKEMEIESPRGTIGYNTYNESYIKEYKLRKFEYNQTAYHNHVVDTIENKNSEILNQHFEGKQFSGWTNPYICT